MGWIKYVDAIGAVSFYNMQFVSKVYTDVLYEEALDNTGSLSSLPETDDLHRIPRATRVQLKGSDGISTLATIPMDEYHSHKVEDILSRIEEAAKDGYAEIRSDDYLVNPKALELLVQ
jgi:hypothetical protein